MGRHRQVCLVQNAPTLWSINYRETPLSKGELWQGIWYGISVKGIWYGISVKGIWYGISVKGIWYGISVKGCRIQLFFTRIFIDLSMKDQEPTGESIH